MPTVDYPLADEHTSQMMARASGEWARILRPGDKVFHGYVATPTCIVSTDGLAYLPVLDLCGELVGLLEFNPHKLDRPIERLARMLRNGIIAEVQASLLFLYVRPALVVDATALLAAASSLNRFFGLVKGERLDIRFLPVLQSESRASTTVKEHGTM